MIRKILTYALLSLMMLKSVVLFLGSVISFVYSIKMFYENSIISGFIFLGVATICLASIHWLSDQAAKIESDLSRRF